MDAELATFCNTGCATCEEKTALPLRSRKQGRQFLPINPHLQKIYRDFFKGKKDYEYAFRNSRSKQNTPISRIRVWQILNEAADAVGYKESLSCHTLRKTFAYWLYMDTGGDIVMVQEILGHADPSITRRYIGIDQQKKEKAINSLKF